MDPLPATAESGALRLHAARSRLASPAERRHRGSRHARNSFASVLPTFTVTGFQQIGPSSGANSRFTTTVTEYLDTFSMVRGQHTFKFGTDIRREALNVLQPANPAGVLHLQHHGHDGRRPAAATLCFLLLGQVSAFTIDIQNQALQERAHIAEFFRGR